MQRIASPVLRPKRPSARPQLEIRDLELVLSLATSGTTARAAAAMHITQSAVSRALTLAERKVGTRLFERNPRGVTPTAAGERLITGAALLIGQLRELEQQVSAPAPVPTRIRVVCECYTAYRWLPSAMANLRRKMPGLEIDIAVEHTRAPAEALARGDIDVALLTTAALPSGRAAPGDLAERPLFSDEIVFVIAASHPLSGRRSVTAEEIRDSVLITSDTPPDETRRFVKSVFGGQRPKLKFLRFPLTEAVIDAARAGMGIAVLSEWIASGYLGNGDLTVKRLASGPLARPWRIAYRRELHGAVERLATAIVSSVPRLYGRTE